MKEYNKIKVKRNVVTNDDVDRALTKRDSIVKGTEHKPGLISRAGKLFFGEEGFKGIATHLVTEVFIPSIQNTVSDLATSAIQRAIYGDSYEYRKSRGVDYWSIGRGYSRIETSRRGYVDYDKRFRHSESRVEPSNKVRIVELDSVEDAKYVISVMRRDLDEFNLVTVADYYELCGVASRFTDHQFGWTDLNKVNIVALPPRRGETKYYIEFPPLEAV